MKVDFSNISMEAIKKHTFGQNLYSAEYNYMPEGISYILTDDRGFRKDHYEAFTQEERRSIYDIMQSVEERVREKYDG